MVTGMGYRHCAARRCLMILLGASRQTTLSPSNSQRWFVPNDEMASGAITVAHDEGIEIPEQLAVIGFDNINFSHLHLPKN